MSSKKDDADDNHDALPISNIVTTFDRFRTICPASIEAICLFDPKLISDDSNLDEYAGTTWVAVFRSNNNQPGVFLRDELFQSMMTSVTNAVMPTTVPTSTTNTVTSKIKSPSLEFLSTTGSNESPTLEHTTGLKAMKPVAVARLRRRYDTEGDESSYYYLLDSMRCMLKKESMDASCDGGSEHTEAIAIAVDTLLRHYLTTNKQQEIQNEQSINNMPIIEGTIRTKATLVSAPILEERGFVEYSSNKVFSLTTHVSSYDKCFQFYADRSVVSTISSPLIRQRSIDIVSLLGRIDRTTEYAAANARDQQQNSIGKSNGAADDTDYDPWATMKKFI
jgi:hypothetical protein